VAVVSHAAHHLADVFSLIWRVAQRTLYLELHGREDGRARSSWTAGPAAASMAQPSVGG
jgi:hypothetical protein